MSQKYILNKSKKLSFLVFFRPHLSVLASFLFGRSGYRRRAFRYIFAHSKYGLGTSTGSVTSSPSPFPNPVPLAKDAAPIPNALAAIKN